VGRPEEIYVPCVLVSRRARRRPQQPRAGGEYKDWCSKNRCWFFLQHMVSGIVIDYPYIEVVIVVCSPLKDDDSIPVVFCSPL
jgi:hypothetical protein